MTKKKPNVFKLMQKAKEALEVNPEAITFDIKPEEFDEGMDDLQKKITELSFEVVRKHSEILDDFAKAYLSEMYTAELKPSELKLVQRYNPNRDVVWFFEPLATEDGQSIEQIREYAKLEGIHEVISLVYDDLVELKPHLADLLAEKYNLDYDDED